MGLRETILGKDIFRYEELTIPEWGGKFLVRELSGEGREAFENAQAGRGDHADKTHAIVVAWSLCNTKKELVFDPRKDVASVSRQPSRILLDIFVKALNLSVPSGKDLEDAEKN